MAGTDEEERKQADMHKVCAEERDMKESNNEV